MKFQTGLYEQLVTEGLHLKIASLDERVIQRRGLHQAEAANRLALHLSRQIESVLSALPEKERVSAAIQVARALLDKLGQLTNTSNLGAEMPVSTGEIEPVRKFVCGSQPEKKENDPEKDKKKR